MIDSSEIAAVSHRLGMQNDITNGSEVAKILILWKDNIYLQGITVHEQFITCSLGNSDSPDAYLTFVYAKCDYLLRRSLWQHLYSFSTSTTIPWLIGGDFNSVLFSDERLLIYT